MADDQSNVEIPAAKARQAVTSGRIITVLVVSLTLAVMAGVVMLTYFHTTGGRLSLQVAVSRYCQR